MKLPTLRTPIGFVGFHAAFLLGACIVSSADTQHVNMLSRHMPEIAYTPANFAVWDGWTKAYAVVTLIAAAVLIAWRCAKRQPMRLVWDLSVIAGAYLAGCVIIRLWSFLCGAVPVLAIPIEIVLMLARWTWLPHTLGVPVLLFYFERDRIRRERWGHDSQL